MPESGFWMRRIFLLVLLATVGVWGRAQGVSQPDGQDRYEIPLKQFDLYDYRTPATAGARQQVADVLTSKYGGEWKVYSWNPQTGTASDVYGSGVNVAAPFHAAQDVVRVERAAPDLSIPAVASRLVEPKVEVPKPAEVVKVPVVIGAKDFQMRLQW